MQEIRHHILKSRVQLSTRAECLNLDDLDSEWLQSHCSAIGAEMGRDNPQYSFSSQFSDSVPASPISPTTFNPLSSSTLAPLLSHYQTYFSQTRTRAVNEVTSPPASSTSASTGSVEGDNELSSDTLYQHACAKQRRSRHDPGGGISQPAILHTPQVSDHPSSAMQMAV